MVCILKLLGVWVTKIILSSCMLNGKLTYLTHFFSKLHFYTPEYIRKNLAVTSNSSLATAQKMKLSVKDFSSKCYQICRKLQIDLVTFTEEILNKKLHFLCSEQRGHEIFPVGFQSYYSKVINEGKLTMLKNNWSNILNQYYTSKKTLCC